MLFQVSYLVITSGKIRKKECYSFLLTMNHKIPSFFLSSFQSFSQYTFFWSSSQDLVLGDRTVKSAVSALAMPLVCYREANRESDCEMCFDGESKICHEEGKIYSVNK